VPDRWFALGTYAAKPGRDCYQELLSSFFLQVALIVPPQAYGGPVVNLDGELIGLLAPRRPVPGADCVDPRFGLELALPSKIIAGLYLTIREARTFQSPWLGFSVMSRDELAATRGVDAFNAMKKPRYGILVENVFHPSPASEAVIKPGDFLVSLDKQVVFAPVDFQRYLYLAGVGKKVRLELFRDGETLVKEITILKRPPEARPK
jgi:serine protease DegQ